MTDFDKAIEDAKAAVLPFESWERLTGESSAAFAAFCAFRDFGPERNIRRAVDIAETDEGKRDKRYRVWRNWCTHFRWRERAADYDRYTEQLKQAEMRKTIEAQGELQRAVTGKMLEVVLKKLVTMNPDELTQGNVTVWVDTAARVEREFAETVLPNGQTEAKQGVLPFGDEFKGL